MQTNFTALQLENKRIAEADPILRSCVHCGFCTATCSTYVLLGDERDSPRGRIYLIKDMFEHDRDASPEVTRHVDRCLSCLSCMTTCPSGVDYMHLVDLARAHITETGQRSPKDRFMRRLLASVVPYPGRFRAALLAGAIAKPFRRLFAKAGLQEMAAMLEFAPNPLSLLGRGASKIQRIGAVRSRVILLKGCAQQVLRPDINNATARLLSRIGVEVVSLKGAGCCGALVHHMGLENSAVAQVKRNVDAWWKVIDVEPIDAIIVTASGCGTTVKDYGHMLKHQPDYEYQGRQIGELAKDIAEFLVGYDLGPPKRWSSLRVAYHSACSMQHGQKLNEQPRTLLKNAGFAVVEIPEGHICCGSAGTYNILQPELARQLRDRKLDNIDHVKPDIIATGNIGCITQLQSGTETPVVHTIQLIDWAYGGPCPKGLEHLKDRVNEVPGSDSEIPELPAKAVATQR
ncbi:MAG: glycolate oxidase subunit GlcF [Hyphomicrobiaceae bacterium]